MPRSSFLSFLSCSPSLFLPGAIISTCGIFVSTDDAYVDGNRVSVSTKILGRIDQLNADEGDTVREGQILVRLDDSDLRAQEAQTKAALGFAKENIEVSKVNLDKAQTDFKRSDAQFRQSIIPKEDFDHAQNELEAAKARLNLHTPRSPLHRLSSELSKHN